MIKYRELSQSEETNNFDLNATFLRRRLLRTLSNQTQMSLLKSTQSQSRQHQRIFTPLSIKTISIWLNHKYKEYLLHHSWERSAKHNSMLEMSQLEVSSCHFTRSDLQRRRPLGKLLQMKSHSDWCSALKRPLFHPCGQTCASFWKIVWFPSKSHSRYQATYTIANIAYLKERENEEPSSRAKLILSGIIFRDGTDALGQESDAHNNTFKNAKRTAHSIAMRL